jgi:asparaginyl-tRNA synthetase
MTGSDCEGAGEVFTISTTPAALAIKADVQVREEDTIPAATGTSQAPAAPSLPAPFFAHPVNLTVSSQLHLEAPTHALSRTYTLSPSFRAEPSLTNRHLSEFYMLEAEVAFLDTLDQLLDVVEDGIKSTLHELLYAETSRAGRAREDLKRIAESNALDHPPGLPEPFGHLHHAASVPFARLTYTEAIEILTREHAETPFVHEPRWGDSLASEHEKWLASEYFGGPVFITRYPASLKPFYMLPTPSAPSPSSSTATPIHTDRQTVEAFDLLLPTGELIGGSLREHRLPELLVAVRKAGLKHEDYEWYLDLRRFGSVPHGGWGMGWERWVAWVSGVQNVRDVVAFPRWRGHCRY